MKLFISIVFVMFSMNASAVDQPYGRYNQAYTYNNNMQYGSTNWYSSPLGMGVAQAGVTLIGGLVSAMTRPDPVVIQQQVNSANGGYYNNGGYNSGSYNNGNGGCSMQTVFDANRTPRVVKICP